jgi:hypothetical protein
MWHFMKDLKDGTGELHGEYLKEAPAVGIHYKVRTWRTMTCSQCYFRLMQIPLKELVEKHIQVHFKMAEIKIKARRKKDERKVQTLRH